MTHAVRVEEKKDRISRLAIVRVPCAVIPVFTGLFLLTHTLAPIPVEKPRVLRIGVPPASVNDFLPLRRVAESLDLPG